jgi:predicted nucleic acid-binding Zn ribbon protein
MRRDPLGSDDDPDKVRGTSPDRVAELLENLAAARGWKERLQGARVHDVWLEAAGEDLARHVRPVRLHGGVLLLEADSAAWATQVRYLSGDLARRVNEVLQAERVTQVRVVTARGPRRARS